MDFGTIRYRLQNDFQLTILTLLGAIAVVGVTPFAVVRALNHEWPACVTDLGVITGILVGVSYAWHTGNTRSVSTLLCYFIGAMAVVASHVLGVYGTYWLYPALIANFFLTDRRNAFIIAVLVLAVLILTGGLFREPREAASFAVTLIVSILLAYAFAYRTAMQRDALHRLASLDALTGLHNRRNLMSELERTQRILARDGIRHGLLILDLDHFKEINDHFGHAQGDEVLIRFARMLESTVRPLDRLFRYGGEEFVILTQVHDVVTLHAMAEKLRTAAEKGLDDGHGNPVTTSIGGAILQPSERTEAWLARADGALYRAKHGGRNRVVIDTGE